MPLLLLLLLLMILVPALGFGLFFLPLPQAYFVRTMTAQAPALWLFRRW